MKKTRDKMISMPTLLSLLVICVFAITLSYMGGRSEGIEKQSELCDLMINNYLENNNMSECRKDVEGKWQCLLPTKLLADLKKNPDTQVIFVTKNDD